MDEKTIARFWAKVDRRGPDDCWEWTASLEREGYGIFSRDCRSVKAHRFSWELANGPIRGRLWVLHACNNKQCVNPRHLELGSRRENVLAWIAMGSPAGRDRSHAKPRTWKRVRPTSEELLWARVTKGAPDDCWPISGNGNSSGYVQVGRKGKHFLAHRLVWQWANGPIPAGLYVCHSCDNPKCVNLRHLWLGTVQDNNRDRDVKGRTKALPQGVNHVSHRHPELRRGTRNGRAKLTDQKVRTIRRLHARDVTAEAIAARYGVSGVLIGLVVRRLAWAHVT